MSKIDEPLKRISDEYHPLILGVTGGIASGKTTVADILKDLGACTIDFDVLARQVVAPGKEALKEIVAFFGDEVLLKDGYLDRKRLSGIVFQDGEKRRKLESVTHPYIFAEYGRLVGRFAAKHPYAIIQAVIPLLFEVDLKNLVHKILVVYIPRDRQIERLVERDGISPEEAENILRAQLPLSEKVIKADYVISNDCPVEETRRQVEDLWHSLREIQKKS